MEDLERHLWKTAKKRVQFKRHFRIYIIVNGFLWIWWLIVNMQLSPTSPWTFPWPLYPLVAWGLAIVLHFLSAYYNNDENAIRKEYERLRLEEQELGEKDRK